MKRIKNILITNAIALNGGDAAILHATIRILKAQFGDGVTITVHDMAARASRRYYPAITFRSDIYSEAVAWARGRVRPAIAAIAVLAVAVLKIGRASGRERVCQSVEISVVAVSLQKKKT